jgi:hypothetical protein
MGSRELLPSQSTTLSFAPLHPDTTMTTPNIKSEEFALLSEFFEQLASRGSQYLGKVPAPMPAKGDIEGSPLSAGVPEDLASVLQKMEAYLSTRMQKPDNGQPTNEGCSRRKPATSPGPESLEVNPKWMVAATFPLGDKYPFTFKLMIHKLYKLGEWAEVVKAAVEKSQTEFKPLTEREPKKKTASGGSVEDARVAPVVAGKGTLPTRIRSHSMFGAVRSDIRVVLTAKAQISKPKDAPNDVRVLKKRCVGRRKTVSGMTPGDTGATSNEWTYKAAASSFEPKNNALYNGRGMSSTNCSPREYQTTHLTGADASGATLTGVEEEPSTGPRGKGEPVLWPGDMKSHPLQGNSGMWTRRRTSSLAGTRDVPRSDSGIPITMKRPLVI